MIPDKFARLLIYACGYTVIAYLYVKESIFWALPLPPYVYEWFGLYLPALLTIS